MIFPRWLRNCWWKCHCFATNSYGEVVLSSSSFLSISRGRFQMLNRSLTGGFTRFQTVVLNNRNSIHYVTCTCWPTFQTTLMLFYKYTNMYLKITFIDFLSRLAIIDRWGPYWTADVPDVINQNRKQCHVCKQNSYIRNLPLGFKWYVRDVTCSVRLLSNDYCMPITRKEYYFRLTLG